AGSLQCPPSKPSGPCLRHPPKGPRRTLVGPTFSAVNRCLAQPAAQAGTPFEATLRFALQGEVGGLRGVRNPPTRDRAPSVRSEPLAPCEQLLDVGELKLDIGRAAVVADAGARRRLHLAQQGVHLL